MNPIRRLACSGLLMITSAQALAYQASIELRPSVEVRASAVSLGQVAVIVTPDLPTLTRLMSVPLGTLRDAAPTLLTRETLQRWLRGHSGLLSEQIEWKGAESTTIALQMSAVPPADLARVAQTTLQQWLAARRLRADVRLIGAAPAVDLPPGRVRLAARAPADARPRRHMQIWVDAFVDERFFRAVPVPFEVAAYASGYVAAADARAGATLGRLALAQREIDVTGLPAPLWSGEQATLDKRRLVRPVRENEPLTATAVETVPEISRGEWATLRVSSGELTLESRVEALQDGRLGQSIRVRPAIAGASLTARVTGPGRLEATP